MARMLRLEAGDETADKLKAIGSSHMLFSVSIQGLLTIRDVILASDAQLRSVLAPKVNQPQFLPFHLQGALRIKAGDLAATCGLSSVGLRDA
jgi:hypothetical protein